MNLKDFKFPEITALDIAFPTITTDKVLKGMALAGGFYEDGPYTDLFRDAFYNGGRVIFKPNVDEEFKKKAWPYCRALMASFAPSHEDKTAICAMIMSELLEPKMAPEKNPK